MGDSTVIKGKASSSDSVIAELRIYCDSTLIAKADTSLTDFVWKPIEPGTYSFTMLALSQMSSTIFEKSCTIKACEPAKPFNNTPISLPGKLEAEDFDEGENSIAYNDTDNNNEGGKYRQTGIDIDASDDGGFVVGWTNTGEWMQYTVKVDEPQIMVWSAKVSSGITNSAFRIYMGDTDLTGRISVPQTGNNSWDTYTEVKGRTKVEMPAGTYKLRILIEGSSCNIDYVTFEKSSGNEVLTSPYNGTPHAIPGTIEAEMFDNGMEGIAYHDNDESNQGEQFRNSGVDIVEGNGGYALGYTAAGEWVLYTVNIEKAQKYYWSAMVSSGTTGAAFRLYIDNEDITGKISIPQTASSSWDTYKTVSGETLTELPAGTHTLKLAIEGANGNIDKIIFSTDAPTTISDFEAEASFNGIYDVFSITGINCGSVEITDGNTSVMAGQFASGIYILRKQGSSETHKIVVY